MIRLVACFIGHYKGSNKLLERTSTCNMARFKIGDRVKANITIGGIYDKTGEIIGYASIQTGSFFGEYYSTPRWKVKLEDGEVISLSEKYLGAAIERGR